MKGITFITHQIHPCVARTIVYKGEEVRKAIISGVFEWSPNITMNEVKNLRRYMVIGRKRQTLLFS